VCAQLVHVSELDLQRASAAGERPREVELAIAPAAEHCLTEALPLLCGLRVGDREVDVTNLQRAACVGAEQVDLVDHLGELAALADPLDQREHPLRRLHPLHGRERSASAALG
jgi:hypothetical protein